MPTIANLNDSSKIEIANILGTKNVLLYDVVNTGTNTTTDLQNFFDGLSGGETVLFPAGMYKHTGITVSDIDDVHIIAYGATSLGDETAAAHQAFTLTNCNNWTIEGFIFDRRNSYATSKSMSAVYLVGCDDCTIKYNTFKDEKYGVSIAVGASKGSHRNKILNNNATGSRLAYSTQNMTDVLLPDLFCNLAGSATYTSNDNEICGNILKNHRIVLTNYVEGVVVSDNISNEPFDSCIYFSNESTDVSCTGNVITNCGKDPIKAIAGGQKGISITGNTIKGSGVHLGGSGYHIIVTEGENVSIVGNTIVLLPSGSRGTSISQFGVYAEGTNLNISDNNISCSDSVNNDKGVWIGNPNTDTSGVKVSDNIINGLVSYPIWVQSTTANSITDLDIGNNKVTGKSTTTTNAGIGLAISAGSISRVKIHNNNLRTLWNAGISFAAVNGLEILRNSFSNLNANAEPITESATATNVVVENNYTDGSENTFYALQGTTGVIRRRNNYSGNTLVDVEYNGISTLSTLKALAPLDNEIIYCKGRTTENDGFEGIFWNDGSDTTTAEDGGVVFTHAGTGRWKRQYSGRVNAAWFDTVANCVSYLDSVAPVESYWPAGSYSWGTTVIPIGVSIYGDPVDPFSGGTVGTRFTSTGRLTDETGGPITWRTIKNVAFMDGLQLRKQSTTVEQCTIYGTGLLLDGDDNNYSPYYCHFEDVQIRPDASEIPIQLIGQANGNCFVNVMTWALGSAGTATKNLYFENDTGGHPSDNQFYGCAFEWDTGVTNATSLIEFNGGVRNSIIGAYSEISQPTFSDAALVFKNNADNNKVEMQNQFLTENRQLGKTNVVAKPKVGQMYRNVATVDINNSQAYGPVEWWIIGGSTTTVNLPDFTTDWYGGRLFIQNIGGAYATINRGGTNTLVGYGSSMIIPPDAIIYFTHLNNGGSIYPRYIRHGFDAGPPSSGGPYDDSNVIVNSSPAVGEPYGWICTVAGSPGTWAAFGQIHVQDTSANIASSSASINTTNKYVSKVVYDTTNNRLMRATGSNSTDAWYNSDGSVSVTPS